MLSPALAEIIGARRLWTVSDDFRGVDAVEIDRRHAEVDLAELALDHLQRDTLAGHLDGVGVAELVGSEAARHPAFVEIRRRWLRAAAGVQGLPRVWPSITQNSVPTGISSLRASHGWS